MHKLNLEHHPSREDETISQVEAEAEILPTKENKPPAVRRYTGR